MIFFLFWIAGNVNDFGGKFRTVVEIKKGVHWVGAVDWHVRDFHGYSVNKGSTYNSYLVLDEKVTLFDAVKKPFKSDMLHNIYKVIEPSKIDYLVVNHVEPDHSGSIPEIIENDQTGESILLIQGQESAIGPLSQRRLAL